MQTVKGKGRCQGELPEDSVAVGVTTPNFFMHSVSCTRGKELFLFCDKLGFVWSFGMG